MDIAKQIVDQRAHKIIADSPEFFVGLDKDRSLSKAFLMLGVAAYLDIDIIETEQYITDGGREGGFDAAYIEDVQDSQVNVILFQAKYTKALDKDSNFPANAVEKAVNTVKCVFDPSAHINLNDRSKSKVNEIRGFILDGHVPYVKFVMLNNGLKWNDDGQNYIDNVFANQEQVCFEHFSHNDILNYIKKTSPIKAQINFSGKALQENYNYKRVIIGRVSVGEIASLMSKYKDNLLEKNIRRYLGRNTINDQIRDTLLSEKRYNFFFFNNGITMICEKFAFNGLQDKDWIVKTEGLQIINGGQTCKTIAQTLNEHPELDYSQTYVLIRLYEVSDDEDVVRDITYATNSQNPVDFRDLKSNDNSQILLEKSANDLGYNYKRKRDGSLNSSNVIPSTVAAEAVFSVWRGKPHLAKYKKSEFFDKYYDEIFNDLNAAQMVIAVLIFRYCDNQRKKQDDDKEIAAQRPFSQYFLAYMLGKRLLRDMDIKVDELNHNNFNKVKELWEKNRDIYYIQEQEKLLKILKNYFNTDISEVDGRTLSAAFRRFDLLVKYNI